MNEMIATMIPRQAQRPERVDEVVERRGEREQQRDLHATAMSR